MSETEVKACPFCGMPVTLKRKEGKRLFFIVCPDDSPCREKGFFQSIDSERLEEGIAAWNTRATDAENQRLKEALERLLALYESEQDFGEKSAAECRPDWLKAVLVNNGPETKFVWKEPK